MGIRVSLAPHLLPLSVQSLCQHRPMRRTSAQRAAAGGSSECGTNLIDGQPWVLQGMLTNDENKATSRTGCCYRTTRDARSLRSGPLRISLRKPPWGSTPTRCGSSSSGTATAASHPSRRSFGWLARPSTVRLAVSNRLTNKLAVELTTLASGHQRDSSLVHRRIL